MNIMSPLLTLDNSRLQAIAHCNSAPASGDFDQPLVSVVIACYNGERYLRETIESALAQSHSRVEVIVVDDGSTDGSAEIAQTFPVRYIHQENRGLTETRNLGTRMSQGDYVVFLDADDRLRPEAIETGLRVIAERPECAMTVGDHLFISSDGSHLSDSRKACLQSSHYEELLKSNFIEMISSVLFRRSVLLEIGGFDPTLRVAEDYDLYLRIARVYPICCHSALTAEYRLHQTNVSRNSELMLRITLQVLSTQGKYVRSDWRRLTAFLAGLRGWRKQYGRQLALELASSSRTLDASHVLRKLLLLLNHYPQGVLAFVLLRLAPGLNKRVKSSVAPAQEKLPSLGFRVWFNNAKSRSTTQFG
jgi:glycosyltransferase involved in cell wall biosynthesis